MRHTIKHEWSDDVQPHPEDNTSEYVFAQVAEWLKTGVLVHPQIALEIAAWWQAPTGYGVDFLRFAGTGTIADDLRDAIDNEIWEATKHIVMSWQDGYRSADDLDEVADNLNALHALRAYVLEAKVTPWRVGHNMAGYSPEATVYAYLDYANAHAQFESNLGELRDDFAERLGEHYDGDGKQICGECEECSTLAFVEADIERYQARPSGRGDNERELSEVYQISGHRNDVYWLTLGEPVTYADYLKDKDSEY